MVKDLHTVKGIRAETKKAVVCQRYLPDWFILILYADTHTGTAVEIVHEVYIHMLLYCAKELNHTFSTQKEPVVAVLCLHKKQSIVRAVVFLQYVGFQQWKSGGL